MAVFKFKQFDVDDHGCGMKICSDSVLLGAWFFNNSAARNILDIGSGSGVLAMIAAQACPDARIVGVEIDPDASHAAAQNFGESKFSGRLKVVNADINHYIADTKYDAVVSNPPYFTEGLKSDCSARAVARHCGSLDYDVLLHYAAANITGDGHLGLISPADYEDDILYHATMCRLNLCRLCRVRTSERKEPARLLWDFTLQDTRSIIQNLTIRRGSEYSSEYLALVDPYYLYL